MQRIGVGGIEAEAALLGQPIYFTIPKVIGLELTGKLPEGITSTEMVLEITRKLRKHGVVNDFVEVFGDGLDHLSVPDRATTGNMSPEFGCTVTYFPVDDPTIRYMESTNRDEAQLELVEKYCRQNLEAPTGLDYQWKDDSTYIKEIPFFKGISEKSEPMQNIEGARVLMKLGDLVTTDHISPAGGFAEDNRAGKYLKSKGIEKGMFNSYGSRRGNHEVMMRVPLRTYVSVMSLSAGRAVTPFTSLRERR